MCAEPTRAEWKYDRCEAGPLGRGLDGRTPKGGRVLHCFFFQAEDGIRDIGVTGVQTCALPICTLLTPGVDRWVRLRHERLTRTAGQLALGDLLTGQLSVRADLFRAAGGFDEDFNAAGSFGAEDTDFLHRLLTGGAAVRFPPGAGPLPRHGGTPHQYLREGEEGGPA